MQTHEDNLHRQRFMDRLNERADAAIKENVSQISGGKEGESAIAQWKSHRVHVKQIPPDEQGILRISIGGGDDLPVALNYCVFRGDHGQCVDLLRRALKAMEQGPRE